jgi:hypothetical protein
VILRAPCGDHAASRLDRAQKQKLYWADGRAMVAITRESGSEAREHFSTAAFGQSSRRMADYGNRRYFDAGEFRPPTLASDDAVIRFVARNPNAIGGKVRGDPTSPARFRTRHLSSGGAASPGVRRKLNESFALLSAEIPRCRQR